MSGLLLKDMYVLTKQLRIFFITAPLFMLSGTISAILFILMLFATLPMTSISYDEQSKWSSYAIMMPYSKVSLVISKYLIGYIFIGVSVVFSVVFLIIVNSFRANIFELGIDVNGLVFGISSALTFLAINLLVVFKFGVEKGRIIYICAFGLIGAIGGISNNIDMSNINMMFNVSPLMFLVVAVVSNIISILFALKIKSKN